MLTKIKFIKVLILIMVHCIYLDTVVAINFTPDQPHINTPAFILLDHNSGKVLLAKDHKVRVEPASLTKMMTMYVVDHEIKAGRLTLNEEVTISKNAWQTSGSRMFLDVNSKVQVVDLIKGIIIQSGNDASVAIAEHIAGTEQVFAGLMNEYAARLGMHNTHFKNATGLPDPEHYSTAEDLSILARAIIKEHPMSYKLYSEKSFIYNNIEQNNRNRLLWRNNSVDGIKTGQTDKAGYCLAVSGVQDQTRLIAVLLGSKNDEMRTTDATKLLTWGFRFFASQQVYAKGQVLEVAKVWGGKAPNVAIGLAEDTYLSIPKNDIAKLTATIQLNSLIIAPIEYGTQVGKYIIKLKGEVIAEYPAIALAEVKKGNFFHRVFDRISMYVNVMLIDKTKLVKT